MGNHNNPCPKCGSIGAKDVQFKSGDMAKYTCGNEKCRGVWFKQWAINDDKSKIRST